MLENGTLELVEISDSFGIFPRHFNFDLTGKFLVVSNHSSDKIVLFEIDLDSGRL